MNEVFLSVLFKRYCGYMHVYIVQKVLFGYFFPLVALSGSKRNRFLCVV